MKKAYRVAIAAIGLLAGGVAARAAVPEQMEPVRRNAIVIAVEKAAPAVVNISTETVVRRRVDPFWGFRDPFFDEFFSDFFRRYGERQFRTTSLGSGVIVDESGLAVTNDHVVRRASKITVTLHDQKQYEATVVGEDPANDLAVLKIEGEGPFPAIEMAEENDLMIGETAIALGNPFGLQSTVTVGVVSAVNRTIYSDGRAAYEGLIQTDAAINPGNSGGPLVNVFGELIGINTAIYAEAQGIGFAIPTERVRRVLYELLDSRVVKKTVFGATLEDFTPRQGLEAAGKGLERGVRVAAVQEGTPADRAGLQAGDVIVRVDGRPVRRTLDVLKAILAKEAGDGLEMEVVRGTTIRRFRVALEAAPRLSGSELAQKKLGLTVQTLTAALAERLELNVREGVLVSDVEPAGPASGVIGRGDVIVSVGGQRVKDVHDLVPLLESVRSGQQASVQFVRGRFVVQTNLTVR